MFLAIFVVVVLLVCVLVHFAFRGTFPVLKEGIVVVTGASSGIGEDAALGLAKAGYTVFAGVRNQTAAEKLKDKHPRLRPLFIDVTKPDSIASAVEEVTKHITATSPLVALVNNAGVQKDLPVELQKPEVDRFVFDVNVFGLLDVSRAFIPLLRRTGAGARLVNVGSLAGKMSSPGSATYVGSKFAVSGITDCMRQELSYFKISVSVIEPGCVHTEIGNKAHCNRSNNYDVSPENHELYKPVFGGFFKADWELGLPENAANVSVTTTAIVHAISSPHPETRYVVAKCGPVPAWLMSRLQWLLPDRLMDWIVLHM